MERPIRGRHGNTQDIKKLPTEERFLESASSFHNIPQQKERDYTDVWKSAILFPDIPSVKQKDRQPIPDTFIDVASNDSLDMPHSICSPQTARIDDVTCNSSYLYKELSTLYQKWSDEDGTEMPVAGRENTQYPRYPVCEAKLDNSSSNDFLHLGRESYINEPSNPLKMSENSMTLAFKQMSLTLVKNQVFFNQKHSTEHKSVTSTKATSSQFTKQPFQPSSTSSHLMAKQTPTDSQNCSIRDSFLGNGIRYCVLCKKNGETREFYTSHVIKDAFGNVVCPVLREFVCPICGATGPKSHTISYCPFANHKKV